MADLRDQTVVAPDGTIGTLCFNRTDGWFVASVGCDKLPVKYGDMREASESERAVHRERQLAAYSKPVACPNEDSARRWDEYKKRDWRSEAGQRTMDAMHKRAAYDEHFAD